MIDQTPGMFCHTCVHVHVLVLQVYVDGVLYAAVLDDVVMQPLTGKLMAVLYRYSTPGQNQHMQHQVCAHHELYCRGLSAVVAVESADQERIVLSQCHMVSMAELGCSLWGR